MNVDSTVSILGTIQIRKLWENYTYTTCRKPTFQRLRGSYIYQDTFDTLSHFVGRLLKWLNTII